MDIEKLVDGIHSRLDAIGQLELAGRMLETADPTLLDVREGSFDEHVAMQPGAIAYFGSMKKNAERLLSNAERGYERWRKKKYAESRAALEANKKKATVADIDAHLLIHNEMEIERWESMIDKLRDQCDTLNVWYEAWRQKSFSLREAGTTLSDERKTNPYMMEKPSSLLRSVRAQKHQEQE